MLKVRYCSRWLSVVKSGVTIAANCLDFINGRFENESETSNRGGGIDLCVVVSAQANILSSYSYCHEVII